MKFSYIMHAGLVTLGLGLTAEVANADQLCQNDGSGCMNISWDCGSFSVPSDLMCVASMAPAHARLGKHAGGLFEVPNFEEDIAKMRRRKAKVITILPDPK